MPDTDEELGNYPDKIARDLRALGLSRSCRIPTLECHKPDVVKALLGGGLTQFSVAQHHGVRPTSANSFCG